MQFDFDALPAERRYNILTSTIVPRPIAWVTTMSADGIVNAAPYSFFNVMGIDPPILIVGIQKHDAFRLKDTGANITSTREFVVNLVTETNAAAMNATSIDAPPDVDEVQLAQLATQPSLKVKPPRIAVSPVAFECKVHTILSFSAHQALVVGRVVQAHVDDAYVLDAARCYIDTPKLALVGRMQGAQWYTRTADQFPLVRPIWKG
jgi:flavin reductase (DIM6/NTAB) family NADH-FMN oxidoreductase RutF